MISIAIVSFLVGFLLYIINNKIVLFYYLIWQLFFTYLLILFLPVLPEELVRQYSGFSNYFLLSIFLLNIHKINYRKYRKLLLLLLSISLFFIILSVYHGLNLHYYQRFIISNLLPAFIYLTLLDVFKVKHKHIFIFIFSLFVIEICLGLIQYIFGIGLTVYSDNVSIKALLGTFSNNNIYISFILFLYLYFLLQEENKLIKNKILKILFALLIFIIVILSGIRTYLLLYLIFVPLIFYIKSRNKLSVIAMLIPLIAIIFSYIISANSLGFNTRDADNAIERQIYGTSNFLKGNDEGSTLSLSIYLLDFFYKNPFLGSGLFYTNLGYGGIIALDTANSTDATFILYLTEFGLFGFLLIMLYYIKLFDISLKNKIGLILFLYVLISTITDIGIFGTSNQVFLILMIYCSSKDNLQNNVLKHNDSKFNKTMEENNDKENIENLPSKEIKDAMKNVNIVESPNWDEGLEGIII